MAKKQPHQKEASEQSEWPRYKKDITRIFIRFLLGGFILSVFEFLEITFIQIPNVYVWAIIIVAFLSLLCELYKHKTELSTLAYSIENLAVLVVITILFLGYSYLSLQFQIYSNTAIPYLPLAGLAIIIFLSTTIFFGVYYMLMYLLVYRLGSIVWNFLKEHVLHKKYTKSDIFALGLSILIIAALGYIEYESQLATASVSFFDITQALTLATGAIIAIMPLFIIGLMQIPIKDKNPFLKTNAPLHKIIKEIVRVEQMVVYAFAAFLITIIFINVSHGNFISNLPNVFTKYNFTNFNSIIQWTTNFVAILFSEVYFFAFIIGIAYLIVGIFHFQKVFKTLADNIK